MGLHILKKLILIGVVLPGSIQDVFAYEEEAYIALKGNNNYYKEINLNRNLTNDSYAFLKEYSMNENHNKYIVKVENSYSLRPNPNRLNTIDSKLSLIDHEDNSYDFLKQLSTNQAIKEADFSAKDNELIPERLGTNYRNKPLLKKKSRKNNRNNIYIAAKGGGIVPANLRGENLADFGWFGHLFDIEADLKAGKTYGLSIGKKLNRWRLEGSITQGEIALAKTMNASTYFGYVATEIPKKTNLKINSYMLNLFRDIKFNSTNKVYPYLGVGAGIHDIKLDPLEFDLDIGGNYNFSRFSNVLFGYNLKGGINYELTKRYSMFTEASFNRINSFDLGSPQSGTRDYVRIHPIKYVNLMTGIRYDF